MGASMDSIVNKIILSNLKDSQDLIQKMINDKNLINQLIYQSINVYLA